MLSTPSFTLTPHSALTLTLRPLSTMYYPGFINSLMFLGESLATELLEPGLLPGQCPTPLNSFLAGMAGGLLQCTALVPAEVIKCKLQVSSRVTPAIQASRNELQQTLDCIQKLYKKEGITGFYRGLTVTALREAPSIGVYFFVYRYMKDALTKAQGKPEIALHYYYFPL